MKRQIKTPTIILLNFIPVISFHGFIYARKRDEKFNAKEAFGKNNIISTIDHTKKKY
jgi:hypothetical protein